MDYVRSQEVMVHSLAWKRRKHYGNRLHGSTRTKPRIRAELQLATGSHRSLAKLYGINPKAAWPSGVLLDAPMGPRDRASQHLSQEQEHLAIALRKQGHLSLDDLMG